MSTVGYSSRHPRGAVNPFFLNLGFCPNQGGGYQGDCELYFEHKTAFIGRSTTPITLPNSIYRHMLNVDLDEKLCGRCDDL